MSNANATYAAPARRDRATDLPPSLHRLERRAATLAERTMDRAADGARAARRTARHLANDAVDARDSAAVYVRRHPLQSVLVSSGVMLAAGVVAGWLLGRRQRH
jgi:ElaB/YqjD/DUF883 family membrane-anchored ribosome-binding protein